MSWLSDHLFGMSKPKESVPEASTDGTTTNEIQNDTVSASKTETSELSSQTTYENRDVTAEWLVPICGKLHKVEFEHGTTSGKRILWIDETEAFRRDWMFKLVGDDHFELGDLKCFIRVDPAPGFKYKYLLFIDGKPLEEFKQRQAKSIRIWEATINEIEYRTVLEKDTLNIFLNGILREEEGEFTDNGTETKWEANGNQFTLSSRHSGNKHDGLLHKLTINGAPIEETSSE